jgi:hypothetical protein
MYDRIVAWLGIGIDANDVSFYFDTGLVPAFFFPTRGRTRCRTVPAFRNFKKIVRSYRLSFSNLFFCEQLLIYLISQSISECSNAGMFEKNSRHRYF